MRIFQAYNGIAPASLLQVGFGIATKSDVQATPRTSRLPTMRHSRNSTLQKVYNYALPEQYRYDPSYLKTHSFYGLGRGHYKRWVFANPSELLQKPLADTFNMLKGIVQKDFPAVIHSPDYGNTWGRRANYIEIIPRVLGTPIRTNQNIHMRDGLFGAMKLLPAIPASQDGIANCVILCGFFPQTYHDGIAHGHKEDSAIYCMDLNRGISTSLLPASKKKNGIELKPDDCVKAFNDLAHYRGLKTGVFMVLSERQLKLGGKPFNWDQNVEQFIQACVKCVALGFDAFYLDSAKHVGNRETHHYFGDGRLPEYHQVQYITHEVRRRTGRPDISFIGERCIGDTDHFKNMGLTAGVGSLHPSHHDVNGSASFQNGLEDYASGPAVSDDNDRGAHSYETRQHRLDACLFGSPPHDKLPVLMTMHDLLPLNWGTNFNDLMFRNHVFGADGKEHHQKLFAQGAAADEHRRQVNEKFAHSTKL